ncbi:hypothetical protein TNIN_319691 [Trichonephila inaurata madagascariensis]|uniref:Uncharacterized protein n=1 Tax=Trichonephila inaurata madagascariensis TaxID=2747483 RepID=A0A8X6YDS7_9ARAC|nr:hypothetical protein TNIN_319691 [Trichonephila inaurata madagascariensis]
MQQVNRIPTLITVLLMLMDSNTENMRFYIFLAVRSSPFVVFNILVIHATILYLVIPNSRSKPLLHYIWMSASEATKAIMKYIVEIADLFTLYTYALVISNTNMDTFKYFESVLGLQLVFMLDEFLLNGFDWDLKTIARLLVVFKYADYFPKIMQVMQVHIKYSVLQYLPYDIFEKVHVYALYLKNVTLIQLFDKPPTFLQDVDTLHIENTKLLRGVIWKLLEPLAHLRVLNIYYNNIKSLGSDFSEHATKELQQLSFYETGTKTIKPGTFRDFVNLDKLAIDHCKITTLSRDMFPVPFNARYLYFNYNQLTYIPDNLFTNMPNLQTIGLRSNNIVVLPESAFFGVTKIQFFQLDDNPITCDCRLAWLIRNKPSAVSGKCNMPSKFKGKDIKDIDVNFFDC